MRHAGFKTRGRNENVFARPIGLPEKTENTVISAGDLDLPERRGVPVVGRRKEMYRCAVVAIL